MAKDEAETISDKWLWILVMGAFAVVAVFWLLSRGDSVATDESASPALPSDEFTTRPEGGVKVDLPDTPMTMAPREEAEPAASEPVENAAN